MNVNGKWCAQDKIRNKQKSFVQKKYEYNDVIKKYLQKIDDQRRKLLIVREEGIEKYKAYNNSYTK